MVTFLIVILALLAVSAAVAVRARRSARPSFLLGSLGSVSTSWLVTHRAEQQ